MIMKAKENSHLIDNVVDALRKAAVELEAFQVQMVLGKAEAKDKYEEAKEKFNNFVHESRYKVIDGQKKLHDLYGMFDELRLQLALGKADTLETFKEQKKRILRSLHEIEVAIKTNKMLNRMYANALIDIELFKVELEILEEKYELGKDYVKEAFEKGKEEFNEFIEDFKAKHSNKKEETQWEHFQSEISEAFSHFKSAFNKVEHH